MSQSNIVVSAEVDLTIGCKSSQSISFYGCLRSKNSDWHKHGHGTYFSQKGSLIDSAHLVGISILNLLF